MVKNLINIISKIKVDIISQSITSINFTSNVVFRNYYKLVYLLITKPYWHIALSIFSIVIIRILFIETIYAESWDYWNPGKFLLSEPVESTLEESDKGVIKYPESMKQIASLLLNIEETKPLNSDSGSDNSASGSDNSDSESDNSDKAPDNNDKESDNSDKESSQYPENWEYDKIVHEFGLIVDNAKSKQEFMEQTLNFVKHVIPKDVWSQNPLDLQNTDSLISQHVNTFVLNVGSDLLLRDGLACNIYMAAVYTYNVGTVLDILNNQTSMEMLYTNTLNTILDEPLVNSLFKVYDEAESLEKLKQLS